MKPLRILHVVGLMNRGGAETLIMNIYRNIDRSKIQFDFLTHHPEKGAYDDEILAMGGRIYTVPYGIKTFHFGYIKNLKKFFENHPEYSIVHSHMTNTSGIICKIAKEYGVKIRIAHSHISSPKYTLLQYVYFRIYANKLIPKYCNEYFACSEAAGQYLFKKKDDRTFKIINNSINVHDFLPNQEVSISIKEKMNLEKNFIIGHVGRFEKQKNHLFLIDLFKEIRKKIPNAKLILIGGGALANSGYQKKIEQKVYDYNLQNEVLFMGVRDDVHDLMKIIDVFLFPSLYEGFPVTLVEAQAAGLTCIISDTITKEIDLGVSNIEFLSLNNPQDWIEKCLKLRECKISEKEKILETFIEKSYDIKTTAIELQNYYLDSVRS